MGNDFDAKFLAEGIELTGPVNEDMHRMLLRGFRVREVQPGVLNVQAILTRRTTLQGLSCCTGSLVSLGRNQHKGSHS